MKFFVTRPQVKKNYYRILCCNYCAMQYLLMGKYPIAYNAGIYGWNYDLYDLDGIALLTGYRGTYGQYINPMEEEKHARAIWEDRTLSYEKKLELIDSLLWEVINRMVKNK